MAYHHILRQNSSFNLIKSSLTHNHFFYCSGICKSLLCHRLEFKSLQNAVKFISTNNSKASDLDLARYDFIKNIYENFKSPIIVLSQKRAFEIARKIIADHREIENCFREEVATIEKNYREEIAMIKKNYREEIAMIKKNSWEEIATVEKKSWEEIATVEKKSREEVATIEKKSWEEIATVEKNSREVIATIEKNSMEEVATIGATIGKKFREEVAMIEKRLQAAQNDYRDLIIRFMRVRGNFNLRGAIEWVREQISKGNYGDYSLLSIPLAITQSSTATNVQNKSSESTTPPDTSPSDQRLVQLMENTTFSENLLKICEINKMTESHVRTCIAGLYHQLSKQVHGYNKQEIAIDSRFFASNEILALGFIFRIYNISYLYYDESGQLNNFPFKI
ncbi:hypothetical protein Glove_330g131 [Diversispora epigaea]|uniref:Uncharacterized protein n=1 Tax=Diversispora epigaea TaxID=1348612 RepID=A0A397HPP8_9GLOM|nr:hypothetical protein Glove_330g131 [Diversispora epigaea]